MLFKALGILPSLYTISIGVSMWLYINTALDAAELSAESGLRVAITRHGYGVTPKDGQVVVFHYIGKLSNGREFDDSHKGAPLAFKLGHGRVIKGFDEAFRQLRVGDQAVLVIPPNLAYGKSGLPPTIPPNEELTFNVTLIDVRDYELSETLKNTIDHYGLYPAKRQFEVLRHDGFRRYYVSERQLNSLGYDYLKTKPQTALAIFSWMVNLFPTSANARDSIAEGYAANDLRSASEESCRRAFKLDASISSTASSFCNQHSTSH